MNARGGGGYLLFFGAAVATVLVMIEASDSTRNRAWARLYAVLAVSALLCVLGARILGPSDAWDQTQPVTIAYTTDMLVNGRWILPADHHGKPATKPPLYNWLAAPAVAAAGHASELAHKLPSVVALVLCFVVVVVLGHRVIPGATTNGAGWLAGVMFVANYTIFKLGYLARPDMLLVLWMLLGWAAATALLVPRDDVRRRWLALAFWGCVGLAAMTKGPAALPLVLYAIVAPRLVTGRWGASRVFGWSWGPALALVGISAWLYAVWRTAPDHMTEALWWREIVGHVTGIGPSPHGPMALITTAADMPWYYVARFEPWCIFAIAAAGRLWTRSAAAGPRRWQSMGPPGVWLHGVVIFVVLMIATYTLVANKRADYLAPVYAPSTLLAAWWLLQAPSWRRWLPVVFAPAALACLVIYNTLEPSAPFRGFGNTITDFAGVVDAHVEADPAPVVCWNTGITHFESFLGYTGGTDAHAVAETIEMGRPFWLVVGSWATMTSEQHLHQFRTDMDVTEACRSRLVPYSKYWPLEAVLYRVEPN